MGKKHFALVGHPIGHTLSPLIHNELFAISGFDAEYSVLDILPENLLKNKQILENLSGYNVTIPHKTNIISNLTNLSEISRYCGSVNTVKNEPGKSIGYTTDGYGFTATIEKYGLDITGKTVILGAGGVARVCAYELAKKNADFTIAVRSTALEKAQSIVSSVAEIFPNVKVEICEIANLCGKINLLINATPCGMYPFINDCPVPQSVIRECSEIFDLIYNPYKTELIKQAEMAEARTVGGLYMLVMQAIKSQEIWTGICYSDSDASTIIKKAEKSLRIDFEVGE